MIIDITYDSSVTSLEAANPSLAASYMSAVTAAVNYYDKLIANPVVVNITFGYGSVAGSTITGGVAESESYYNTYSYSQLYNALAAADKTSLVQQAAFASLSATDPTGGASFGINTAEARALGLLSGTGADGFVGINSSLTYSWSQSSIAAGAYDATGAIEHEISEILGRRDTGGSGGGYTTLDLYRYTAADGKATDAPGSAAGARDEPFAAGYKSTTQSYFSYTGTTVTLPYDTPAQVAAGDDVADWTNTVANDSDGFAFLGQPGLVSATDIEEMGVLGYAISDTLTETVAAKFSAATHVSAALNGLSISETSPIGGNVLTTAIAVKSGVITIGTAGAATVTGNGSSSVTIAGSAAAIDAALASAAYLGNTGFAGTDTLTLTSTI